MAGENTTVYFEQGGNSMVIAEGGTIKVGDGSITLTTDGSNNLIVTGLPTSDPSVAGALWADTGVVTVSAG